MSNARTRRTARHTSNTWPSAEVQKLLKENDEILFVNGSMLESMRYNMNKAWEF